MSGKTATRRKCSRRQSYGTARHYNSPARGVKREAGPSKREQAASDALNAVLEVFESGELPARIAETVIARAEGASPAASWSLGNQLLCILAGTSDARGYRQWQEVGRHVSKGAKALYILAPRTRKIREENETTGEESERVIVSGFLGVPVFRLEDTEGFPLQRYNDYRPCDFPPLFEVAERLGVPVAYAPFAGRFRGYYNPGDDRIMLCSHDVRTFFHELAHAAHARVLKERGEAIKPGQTASQEIVAETVAATLCKLYDIEAGALAYSAEYVGHYSKGGPARAAMRVLHDVQAVLYLILDKAEAVPVAEPASGATAA